MRCPIFISVLVTACVLVPATAVLAQSSVFQEENHSPATAYEINDPAKSWAIYAELEHEPDIDAWV